MGEDRKRAKNPKVAIVGFSRIQPTQFRACLASQGVEARKVTPTGVGHLLLCESRADCNRLLALDRCGVEVAGGMDVSQDHKIDTAMTVHEVLDLISERLGDEEFYNDT